MQIKGKVEEKTMRRGAGKQKRVQIKGKEEEKAVRRDVGKQTRKECRLRIRWKRRQ